jgi:5-enolpyruvylshikimate-3-phosphate synthase
MIAVPAVHRIRGIKHLKIKESDRIQVLAEHLEKLNVSISEEAGNVTIDTRDFNGIDNFVINSTDDHRMAMALSCLTQYVSSSSVPESDVVKKSFPGFWNELSKFMSVTNA